MDVVKCADWVVDLGPEGGAGRGRIVAEGTPEHVAQTDTHTGRALTVALGARRMPTARAARAPAASRSLG